jgi:hypothetical protein
MSDITIDVSADDGLAFTTVDVSEAGENYCVRIAGLELTISHQQLNALYSAILPWFADEDQP